MIEIRNLLTTSLSTDTRVRSSIIWLPLSLSFLFLCALSICDTELGLTMKFPEDIRIKILLFIAQMHSEHNISPTGSLLTRTK